MNGSIAGKCSRMSSHNPVNDRKALRRSAAVSKVCGNRTRISYRVRSRGNLANNPSSFALSVSDRSLGWRRNSHIRERNSFRSALDSWALYAWVIFPPLPVHGLVELLGDVETIDDCPGVGQQSPAGVVERLAHVSPVRLYLPPLLLRHLPQAVPARRLVPPLGHGEHLGPVGVGQIRQERDIEFVPLLQAQLVDPHVTDQPLGIDLFGLGVGQLVADDQADGL